MSIIEEAERHVENIRTTDSEIMWESSVIPSLNIIEDLIKELQLRDEVVEAADNHINLHTSVLPLCKALAKLKGEDDGI